MHTNDTDKFLSSIDEVIKNHTLSQDFITSLPELLEQVSPHLHPHTLHYMTQRLQQSIIQYNMTEDYEDADQNGWDALLRFDENLPYHMILPHEDGEGPDKTLDIHDYHELEWSVQRVAHLPESEVDLLWLLDISNGFEFVPEYDEEGLLCSMSVYHEVDLKNPTPQLPITPTYQGCAQDFCIRFHDARFDELEFE